MTDFFVGQKVVCLVDSNGNSFNIGGTVKRDAVYTVRWVGMFKFAQGERPGIKINEVIRVWGVVGRKVWDDCPWGAEFFRPLDSKAIEVFRKIAQDVTDGKKVKIDAD